MLSHLPDSENPIQYVSNFQELVTIPFGGNINAISWRRTLEGDFEEIVQQLKSTGNITVIDEEDLTDLNLSDEGQLAREVILSDLKHLQDHGASPLLNLISGYDVDDTVSFFPTDVYSFHVDRSPVPTDTILCTYFGEPSEILPNAQADQKILIPEIREKLKQLYNGSEEGFDVFLSEHFFDLHYQAKPYSNPISLGVGNLCRLAVDHPNSTVLPSIHRAPHEKGKFRLMLIC